MQDSTDKSRNIFKYLLRMFRLERCQSPLFFYGIICFLWRVGDFVPGNLGIAYRWAVGRARFKKLGKFPYFRSHNTMYDGRELEIGNYFHSGKYNYFSGGPIHNGNRVSLANFIIIETADHLYDDLSRPISKQEIIHRPVVIEDDVWLANRVTVLGGVTIGRSSIIGAGSVVTQDVPPFSLVVGNPARVIRKRGAKGQAGEEALTTVQENIPA